MDKLTSEVLLAAKSVFTEADFSFKDASPLLTQEEYDALLRPERRERPRNEVWSPFERFVRVPLLKLRGRV